MLTILTGPEAIMRARAWAEEGEPALWVDYALIGCPESCCLIEAPPYPALAAFASRLAHPTEPPKALRITELSCLATGAAAERAPTLADFAGQERLMRLSALVAKGQPVHRRVALVELSRLYDRLFAEVGRGLASERQKTLEFGRALASDALAHLISDLKRSGSEIVATTSDVQVQGKLYPNIPGSVRSMAELELACEAGARLVTRSLLPLHKIGEELP